MEAMRGKEVWKAARATAAHALLLTFTIVLVLKLHPGSSSLSWWFIFSPLWLFHAVMYRSRFSIPAPSNLDIIPWDPIHSVLAMPLLIAFELLLCVYLESSHVNHVSAVNLEIVFLPIFLLETIILLENLRMLGPHFLEDFKTCCLGEELTPDQQEWRDSVSFQILITLLATFSMAIALGITVLLVQTIIGNGENISFWSPCLFFSYALVPWGVHVFLEGMGYRDQVQKLTEASSSTSALVAKFVIGGQYFILVLIIGFPVLLCMYVEGTPIRIPIPLSFSPLFLWQGVGVLFSTLHLVERIVFLSVHREFGNGRYLTPCSRACDLLVSIGHGLRFLGWGSIDDGSREVEARRFHECELRCNTFCGSPPDTVKKMRKKDLVEEVCTLQAAINEQIQFTESSLQEYKGLRSEKVVCRVCFQRDIGVVFLPCRHRISCRMCGDKCSNCPICSVSIAKLVCVYYA